MVLHICEAMEQDHFNNLEIDTCLLMSWKSSPALLVL